MGEKITGGGGGIHTPLHPLKHHKEFSKSKGNWENIKPKCRLQSLSSCLKLEQFIKLVTSRLFLR